MSVRKAADFIADVELQYQWYAENAGWEGAERYLRRIMQRDVPQLSSRQPLP
jgi:hypothetical protein